MSHPAAPCKTQMHVQLQRAAASPILTGCSVNRTRCRDLVRKAGSDDTVCAGPTAQGGEVTQIHPGSGPTALRILLGSQLRRLREARGLSREEAGHLIRGSESKISRMEL